MSDTPPEANGETNEFGARRRTGLLGLLGLGHLCSDFYATMLNPILPELGRAFSLTLAQTQMLPALGGIFGSMLQPFVGALGDRFGHKAMVAIGTAGAGIFIAAVGYATGLSGLLALVALGSIGVAIFHPNAASLLSALSPRRGRSLGWFLVGGSVGLALAPALVTRILKWSGGLHALLWLAIPGIVLAAAYVWLLPGPTIHAKDASRGRPHFGELFGRGSGTLWLLFVIVTLRSMVFTAFATFMGHLSEENGWTLDQRGWALSLFMIFTAVGAIAGGWLSDHMNRKALLSLSCFLGTPLLGVFAMTPSYGVALAFLLPAGVTVHLAKPMIIVYAQDLCPSNQSAASGLMMGLAWGLATLCLPLIGKLAELQSIRPSGALLAVSGLCTLAGVLAFLLPKTPAPESA